MKRVYANEVVEHRGVNVTGMRMSEGHVYLVGLIGMRGHMEGMHLKKVKGLTMSGGHEESSAAAGVDLRGALEGTVVAMKARGAMGLLRAPCIAAVNLSGNGRLGRRGTRRGSLRVILADLGGTDLAEMVMLREMRRPARPNGGESRGRVRQVHSG